MKQFFLWCLVIIGYVVIVGGFLYIISSGMGYPIGTY